MLITDQYSSQDVVDGNNKLSIGKPSDGSQFLKIIGLEGNNVVAVKKVPLASLHPAIK